jgi:hypothetical protein
MLISHAATEHQPQLFLFTRSYEDRSSLVFSGRSGRYYRQEGSQGQTDAYKFGCPLGANEIRARTKKKKLKGCTFVSKYAFSHHIIVLC